MTGLAEALARDPCDLDAWLRLEVRLRRGEPFPASLREDRALAGVVQLLARHPGERALARCWAELLGVDLVPAAADPGRAWRGRAKIAGSPRHWYDPAAGLPLAVCERRAQVLLQRGPVGPWLGRTPVTLQQFRRFAAAQEAGAPGRDGEAPDPRDPEGLRPVVRVGFEEAEAFCAWVGGRLPLEAEWQQVLWGEGRYPWGEAPLDPSRARYAEVEVAAGVVPSLGSWGEFLVPPGSCPGGRGPAGHDDVLGLVWEWCQDREGGRGVRRRLRGGSWRSPAAALEAPAAGAARPGERRADVGFRVAADLRRVRARG